jgi:hypothetical protein
MNRDCLLNSKGFKNSKFSIIDILISLFYYFIFIFLPFLGFTNPTPLTEISSSRFVRKGCICNTPGVTIIKT